MLLVWIFFVRKYKILTIHATSVNLDTWEVKMCWTLNGKLRVFNGYLIRISLCHGLTVISMWMIWISTLSPVTKLVQQPGSISVTLNQRLSLCCLGSHVWLGAERNQATKMIKQCRNPVTADNSIQSAVRSVFRGKALLAHQMPSNAKWCVLITIYETITSVQTSN